MPAVTTTYDIGGVKATLVCEEQTRDMLHSATLTLEGRSQETRYQLTNLIDQGLEPFLHTFMGRQNDRQRGGKTVIGLDGNGAFDLENKKRPLGSSDLRAILEGLQARFPTHDALGVYVNVRYEARMAQNTRTGDEAKARRVDPFLQAMIAFDAERGHPLTPDDITRLREKLIAATPQRTGPGGGA